MYEKLTMKTSTPNGEKSDTPRNSTGIPDVMKRQFEAVSGFSFDDVQVHYSSHKPAQFQAFAYTQGDQVYIGPGQERYLPHELGHVVQQKQGRVTPTTSMGKIDINDDTYMEREATSISLSALQLTDAEYYSKKQGQRGGEEIVQLASDTEHVHFGERIGIYNEKEQAYHAAIQYFANRSSFDFTTLSATLTRIRKRLSDECSAAFSVWKNPEQAKTPAVPASGASKTGSVSDHIHNSASEIAEAMKSFTDQRETRKTVFCMLAPLFELENKKQHLDKEIARLELIIKNLKEDMAANIGNKGQLEEELGLEQEALERNIRLRGEAEREYEVRKGQLGSQDERPEEAGEVEKPDPLNDNSIIIEGTISDFFKVGRQTFVSLRRLIEEVKSKIQSEKTDPALIEQYHFQLTGLINSAVKHILKNGSQIFTYPQKSTEDYPTMVYETFGPSAAQLVSIYEQSCQYPGHTICVLGLNSRSTFLEWGSTRLATLPTPDPNELYGMLSQRIKHNHDVYILPFVWKATGGKNLAEVENKVLSHHIQLKNPSAKSESSRTLASIRERNLTARRQFLMDLPPAARTDINTEVSNAAEGGYDLPYFEVRSALMSEAQTIAAEQCIPETEILYRWIDRDAENDTTAKLKLHVLKNIAQALSPVFFSGIYNWREADEGNSVMRNIYPMLNKYEKRLRKVFYEQMGNLQDFITPFKANFYLPEPALIMNGPAHGFALNNLIRKTKTPNAPQAGESMVAFGMDDASTERSIEFSSKLSVSKPDKKMKVKNSADIGDTRENFYLHKIEELLKKGVKPTFKEFCIALKSTRQSVFDNGQWSFVAGRSDWDDYNSYKAELDAYEGAKTPNAKISEKYDDPVMHAQLILNRERYYCAKEFYDALPLP